MDFPSVGGGAGLVMSVFFLGLGAGLIVKLLR